uniref:Uncharacterized protein n=1 Tax=Anas zonorhyncha TaxID=75864 RepID=A0A8B9UW11_9AVES
MPTLGWLQHAPRVLHSHFPSQQHHEIATPAPRSWSWQAEQPQPAGGSQGAKRQPGAVYMLCFRVPLLTDVIYMCLCGEPHVLRSFAERGETGELNHLLAYSFLLPLSFRSTHIQVVGFDNRPFARTSCGTEGFQNAKKGTAIAAQTAGIAAATRGSLTASCCYLGTGEWRTSTVTSAILGGNFLALLFEP